MTNKGMAAIKSANKKEEQIISIPQYWIMQSIFENEVENQ